MPRFCEKSIHWILSYRNAPRKKLHQLYRYGFVKGHTEDTWKWTLQEAKNIEQYGFDYWLSNMDGARGYWYMRNKYLNKT